MNKEITTIYHNENVHRILLLSYIQYHLTILIITSTYYIYVLQ